MKTQTNTTMKTEPKPFTVTITSLVMSPLLYACIAKETHPSKVSCEYKISAELHKYNVNAIDAAKATVEAVAKHIKHNSATNRPFSVTLIQHNSEAGKSGHSLTAEVLNTAITRIRSGEYGDGIRARFERQGGPLQFRTLCKAAGISGDYETANELSGFYFSR